MLFSMHGFRFILTFFISYNHSSYSTLYPTVHPDPQRMAGNITSPYERAEMRSIYILSLQCLFWKEAHIHPQ